MKKVVSIIIPILNEEKYIEKCLESILSQNFPKELTELILIDGMSTDKTMEIIQNYAQKYDHIKIFKNKKKTVQFALNIGIKEATGDYIVRMDAHSIFAKDYILKCVEILNKTKAANVGGIMLARGKTKVQKIIAAAYHSKFALGGGKNHDEKFEGYADTVFLGAFKRKYLLKVGLYDERFPRNEDDELNLRIAKSGDKIFISNKIKLVYFPRDSFSALFKQYYEYGLWKIAVIKKHKKPVRFRQLFPFFFVMFLITFGILAIFSKTILQIFLGILSLYLGINFIFSFFNKKVSGISNKIKLMYTHFVIHFSYGFGFLNGIIKFFNHKF